MMRARIALAARILVGLAVAGIAAGFSAAVAQAQFGVANNCTRPTTGTNTAPNQPCWNAGVYNDSYTGMADIAYVGPPAQQSGGHPFTGVTDFTVTTNLGVPDGTVKNIRVDIPPGLVSNPLATPKCTDTQLTARSCPSDTQLGIVELAANLGVTIYAGASVYNMTPDSTNCPGYVSDYAFEVTAVGRVNICGSVNEQPPYNLYFTIVAPAGAATVSSTLIFWGVPGDSGHNPDRGWSCFGVTPCSPPGTSPGTPSGTPFITNPTGCVPAGQVTTLTLESTTGQTATSTSDTAVPATDCSALPFSPTLTLALTGRHQTAVGKHPTLTATVTQPSGQANIGLGQVTLPLSLALDPNNSQHVCSVSDAQADTCPSSTLIGSATATTPLLTQPLTGPVYLEQGIRTNGEGQQIRTFPWLHVELRGQAAIDLTAQTSVSHKKLVTTFSQLPDLPESSFTLTINGGSSGILVVTGKHSLCSARRQRAPMLLEGHNGATEQRTLTMTTPCTGHKKHKKHHKR